MIVVNQREFDAIIAALVLLAQAMDNGTVRPDDGDIGDILTNAGLHHGLTADEVEQLKDRLLCG